MPFIRKDRLLENPLTREVKVRDRLVIIEKDGRLCEILPVTDINSDRILAPGYSVPWQDVQEYISPEGRVFVVHAPEEYIMETRHLAEVEQATVIRSAIQYERVVPPRADLGRYLPWAVIVILILVLAFKH